MNYLIAHKINHFPYLHSTPRKKSIKHKLIYVQQGVICVRLGKEEYVFEQGQALWLPFECLSAVTYFPNTTSLEVEVSCRSTNVYSYQAGEVELSELLSALLKSLANTTFDSADLEQKSWLKVVNFELTKLSPLLSSEMKTITNIKNLDIKSLDNKGGSHIDYAELHMALKVRDALKARSSGMKTKNIVESVFNGNHELAQQLCQAIANQAL
ncbi:AraC family transcriptional regulator [Vibrio gangliei]|uniref:AraC family transcriptional regulator n=1 Tax=Vibrio gangliei TaxID=2077090 RepID=UPI000D01A932|nr:AraC family transcriptional regulator [Vibrio gangliei]